MKKILVLGVLALALIFTVGLTSCASVDQQTLKKAGVPQDQRATLYWVLHKTRLEKIDGKKQDEFLNLYGLLGGLPGVLKEKPKGMTEAPLNTLFSVQV